MNRSTAFGRALFFLVATAPIWALKQVPVVFHPVVLLFLTLALTLLFLWWDRRPVAVLGLDPRPRRVAELAVGVLAGVLLVGLVAAVMYFALPFPWQRNTAFEPRLAAWALLYYLVANGVEELAFRGYAFDRMIAAIGHWPAQIVIALVFAFYPVQHGWTWGNALVGTTIGSILFGLVFVRWRSVPAALGVHAGANWARDLLLADPATAKTFVSPFSLARWAPEDVFTARVTWNGVMFLACVAMAVVVYRHRRTAVSLATA